MSSSATSALKNMLLLKIPEKKESENRLKVLKVPRRTTSNFDVTNIENFSSKEDIRIPD